MNNFKCISILLFAAMCACEVASRAKIEGTFVNYPNDSLTVCKLDVSTLVPVDTVVTNKTGKFFVRLKMKKGFPEFYYIRRHGKTLSSLLVLPGDRISLTVDTAKRVHTVTGSIETAYLHEAESVMATAQHRYDSLMRQLLSLDSKSPEAIALNYALGSLYVKQKQAAIRFLFTYPRSISSVQVLFQKFSDDLPLFADNTDALYFQRLYDSLRPLYPRSPYIAALRDQSEWRKREMEINDKLLNAKVLGFPELVLPDVQAQPVALSLLKGKVIILSFWLSQDSRQRIANQEWLELYRKYASKGLEIYQVSLDTDKTAWARTVAEQALPWISVCDGYGVNSKAVATYVVSQVPSNFLINQEGDIVGRDFSMEKISAELARLCR